MPTVKDDIDQVLIVEGGSKVTNDPSDHGSRTQYGISEKSNPGAWADGRVTEPEARDIYMQKYLVGTGIVNVADPYIQAQLLDYAINSGPYPAISRVQEIVGVKQDGILGPGTLSAIKAKDPRLVNNALVRARILMICKIVQKDVSQVKYLLGWASRALEFII